MSQPSTRGPTPHGPPVIGQSQRLCAPVAQSPTYRFREGRATRAGVRIDPASRRVHRGDDELSLRPKEFDLLALLAAEAGRVVSRERIMREVWDTAWLGSTKTLDNHILSLRSKLGDEAISTLRGIGYRLEA